MQTVKRSPTQGQISRIAATDGGRWRECIAGAEHDFYHGASYHHFAEACGEGTAFLALYREGERRLLWPYLQRPIQGLPGFHDVTSVYGYPGPLSAGGAADAGFLARGCEGLLDLWRSEGAVSAFTRLHPLLSNHHLLPAGRPAMARGKTVSLDLRRAPAEIWSGYRKTLRQGITRARRAGLTVGQDTELCSLSEFGKLYRETMARNRAAPGYFFSDAYLRRLFAHLAGHARLTTVLWERRVVAGAVVVEWNGFVSYHLSATSERFLPLSPAKLLLDEIRLWAQQRGCHTLHLGGGRGGQGDSLFHFKTAFSAARHDFHTWNCVVRPEVYRDLTEMHRRQALTAGQVPAAEFFPLYGSPLVPVAAQTGGRG